MTRGEVLGETRTGKVVYSDLKATAPEYAGFTETDHDVASRLHGEALDAARAIGDAVAAAHHDALHREHLRAAYEAAFPSATRRRRR